VPTINELLDYHARLLAIAKKVEHLLDQPRSPDSLSELASLRATMFETLGAYQGFVHRDVYEEAKRIGEPEQLKRAEGLKASCVRLSFEYQSFAMRWSNRPASESWPEYRLSALRMISAVREHVREGRSSSTS
jgi:hypothetical protein